MNSLLRSFMSTGMVICLICIPSLSFATNGIYLIGYGAKSRAMGGTAIGLSEDTIYTHSNPAALGNLKLRGAMRIDFDAMIFHPERRVACCLAPGGKVSGAELFVIPAMGMAYKFNRKITVGMSFVGSGGGNTRYNPNFFDAADGGSLGVNFLIAEMSPTVAYKINKANTVGISPVIAIQSFRAYGLGPFKRFSIFPEHVTNNGNDWSYGAGLRLGWQGKFFKKKLTTGVSWTSKRYMTEFDKYKGLFAEQGNFDHPESYGIGLSFKPIKDLTLAFDWTRTLYEDLAAVGNASLPISATPPISPNNLGQPNGPGFGWENQDVFKLGLQYDLNKKWTVRAGINYGESPIPDEDGRGEHEFNVLAPAVTDWHYTLGGSYRLGKQAEFSLSFVHAPRNSQTANVPSGTGLPFEDQDITLEMQQNSISATFSYQM